MAAAPVTVLAPAANTSYQTRGATYASGPTGLITGVPVAAGWDLLDLEGMGCQVVSTIANIGTPAATVVTAAEYGNAYDHTTVLTFAGVGAVLPAIVGGAALGVGTLIYTFPAGAQSIDVAQINVGVTQTQGNINANTPAVGLGHVVASGVVSVLSGTATFQSIAVGKVAANCTGTATVQTASATASPFTLITDIGGVKSVYLNAAATWSASGDSGAKLTGSITLKWRTLS